MIPTPPPATAPDAPATRRRVAFLAVVTVVVVLTSFQYLHKASKPSRDGTLSRTAFLRWRQMLIGERIPTGERIPSLKGGDDIYKRYKYPNPPVMPLVLWPFAELPPMAGAMAWFYLKATLAAAALVWVFRLCESAGRPVPDWAKGVTVLLSLHPILGDLSHGNVNIFVAFLVVAALEAYRRRWDVTAGVVMALAIACKVTPALFLPYFVWKRAWKLVAACGLGLGLWLFVVPGAVLGWGHNVTLLTSWFEEMVKPFLIDGKVTSERANQSIPGLTVRLLTAEPSKVGYDEEDDDRPFGAAYHNLADIGPANARLVVRGFQAAFVLAVVVFCRAPRADRQGVRVAAEYSLIVLGMLLFSERTWKHHGVTLILPYAALTAYLAARPLSPGPWGTVTGLLGVAAALTILPSGLGDAAQDVALIYGSYTIAFLLLTVAVCVVMWAERVAISRAAGVPSEA